MVEILTGLMVDLCSLLSLNRLLVTNVKEQCVVLLVDLVVRCLPVAHVLNTRVSLVWRLVCLTYIR